LHSRKGNGPVVQLVRMPPCHGGGRGFESRPVRSNNVLKPSETTVFCVNTKSVQKTATRRTKFKHMNCPYTLPEIKRYSNNDWCVEYTYQFPEDWPEYPAMKRIKVREGVNYIKDPVQKEEAIVELCRIVQEALKSSSYNPFDEIVDKRRRIEEERIRLEAEELAAKNKQAELSIEQAFLWFKTSKEKLGRGDRTIEGYVSYMKNFRLWIELYNSNPSNTPLVNIEDIKTETIETYLEVSSDDAEWKARTYNNNLKGLITIFTYLKTKKKIVVNPLADKAIETRTSRSEKNKYYSKSLRALIQPELDKVPYLDLFIKWIYYSCARTNELPRLRISDIDLDLRKIKVPAMVGKTGAHIGDRTIPICEELYDIIMEMGIMKYPLNHYIFTKAHHPGPVMLPDDYFRDQYLPIKRLLKLDTNYTMYSFKHTRVVDLLAAGFSSHLVMFLTGHTDWKSFQAYCKDLGAVIDDQLKGKTLSY
jgi:integrase